MPKISIIGAGNVGATTAFLLLIKDLGDIVLVDVLESVKGKAFDMQQAQPILGFKSSILGTTDYKTITESDLVIITAGIARKPGMTRDELLEKNFSIVKSVCEQVKKHAPKSVVIVVTNPLDLMAYTALRITGFPRERVIGMAGTLDTSRFKLFLEKATKISSSSIETMVLGSHGNEMTPLVEHIKAEGKQLQLEKEKITAAVERTRNAGAEIVKYLGTGSAYYAPAAAIFELCKAIINAEDKVLSASVYLRGEYSYNGIFLGVPVKLGKEGVKEIVEIALTAAEREMLDKSAASIKEKIAAVDRLLARE